jgi:hypothetical protein
MSKIYVDEIAGIASADTVAIPGHVIQVVQVDTTTQVTTTSSTFVTTGHSLTITPSSTNSKIYIVGAGPVYNGSSGAGGQTTIYRGSTNINAATHGMGYLYTAGGDEGCSAIACKLDSPNTTSAVTYTMYFRQVGGGTFYYSVNAGMSTLTAMEIAG